MSSIDGFKGVMVRLREGREDAAEEIFARYVRRLTALASRQFDSGIRHRADPEGVVQSVYRSFFSRDVRSHYQLEDWESLWKLLAVITVRKCSKRRLKYRKEPTVPVHRPGGMGLVDGGDWIEAIDRAPTPAEAAALTEIIGRLFGELNSADREMAERILQGYTAVEIADHFGCCERTVRRLRKNLRDRLEQLNSEDG